MTAPSRSLLIALTLSLGLTGCFSPSPPARFYQLRPTAETTGVSPSGQGLSVVVGPVEVAPYLSRPQMAWRQSPHELSYDEMNRWAEPLRRNIATVLASNLSRALGTESVAIFPWDRSIDADVRVAVSLLILEGEPGGKAQLTARWLMAEKDVEKPVASDTVRLEVPVQGDTVGDVVAAESALLGQLSDQIADAIQTLTE